MLREYHLNLKKRQRHLGKKIKEWQMCGGNFTTILAGDGLYLGYQKGSPVERQQRGFSG